MSFWGRVNKTYAYGKIFNYKRSLEEIYFWLIGDKRISQKTFFKKISSKNKNFLPKSKTNKNSLKKIELAKKELSWVLKFPLICFIGITGSVSANNAKKNDDIDIFIITTPHSLWLARPIFLLYLEIRGLRRKRSTPYSKQSDLICTNLWMDVLNLSVQKKDRNLYTAHEVLLVLPIVNKNDTYQKFLVSNSWVKKYLANAYSIISSKKRFKETNSNFWFLLSPFNLFMYLVQRILMFPVSKGERVSYFQAFFHDQNYSKKVLSEHNKDKSNYN
ncbi:hypothetical protein A2572_03960 [Candidatus Collierbacteria bacterium RIFOXYD1_FULL_40_9]|uniref:Polymerase nucleotidyl transferase domain-containing protein n=1 Tax=Candidatus Collierbacteria bacterium RIFOXYD1_FULL_40_9 TaxID=1817731 RepID=A0A1F5FV84_9BACT|nr:MAG: hypothetical protein A2572_03960 [Candidatus Collierbacteria bacterium RIFOXYD1_FULL_40_9]